MWVGVGGAALALGRTCMRCLRSWHSLPALVAAAAARRQQRVCLLSPLLRERPSCRCPGHPLLP